MPLRNFVFIIILISFKVLLFSSDLSKEDINIIKGLLHKKNLSLSDLNFEKDWASSTKLKLNLVTDILNNPLKFPAFSDSVKTLLAKDKFPLSIFSKIIFSELDSVKIDIDEPLHLTTDGIFNYVYNIYNTAFKYQQLAFINLNQKEKNQLKYLSYSLLSEEEDSTRYERFYKKNKIAEFDSLKTEEIIDLLYKVNFNDFYHAASIFYNGFYELNRELRARGDFSNLINGKRKTRFGDFIINADDEDNIYTQKAAFILDISGNDFYKTDLNTDIYSPFFMQIDLAGNDRYQNNDIGGLFSARFGFIAHSDLQGNDVYIGNDYSLSAWLGYLFFYDYGGDDIYKAGLHSLGAATIGLNYFYDKKGNDIYSATEFAEGFASVLGLGILQDDNGNDVYYCGGRYLHKPLAPNDYRTMSQGYGFGLRPDIGGGVGILYDKGGNDYYDGGVFSLGGAYWYAIGMLLDENGNDFYNSVYYPQGSGIHLACGYLCDDNGEDEYYSKHGPGMGAGHDYSVGFLIDKNGDDQYSVEGGLGLGLTNSVGIFVDKEGNDRYVRRYAKNCGWANKSRDTGGIGIFVDENGKDEYANDFAKNNSKWFRGYFGFAIDTTLVKPMQKDNIIKKESVAEIDSLSSIKEIFKIASGWGVNSNRKRVDRALEILLSREKEAAGFIAKNKMNTKSGLTYRAIKKFSQKSKEIRKYFPELLSDDDSLVVKNTISLIATLKDSTYLNRFKIFLKKKKYVKTVLSALGYIKSDKSVDMLAPFVRDKDEKVRIIVARSLFKIGNKKAKRLLNKLKNDKSFLIKAMFMIKEEKEKN